MLALATPQEVNNVFDGYAQALLDYDALRAKKATVQQRYDRELGKIIATGDLKGKSVGERETEARSKLTVTSKAMQLLNSYIMEIESIITQSKIEIERLNFLRRAVEGNFFTMQFREADWDPYKPYREDGTAKPAEDGSGIDTGYRGL